MLFKRILCFTLAVLMLLPLLACTANERKDEPLYTPNLKGTEESNWVEVKASVEHQEIKGFGGINFPTWIDDLTKEQRQTAFGNGEDELGFTILRIHIDPDKSNWEKELETAKAAQKAGALIFASPWNPPSKLCERFTHGDNEFANRLRHDKYAEYAEHLNDFVTFMRDNGVELYAISFQNEPDYADEWTWWNTEEIMDFILNYSDVIDCRLMTPESFQYKKDYYNAILNDENALEKIDIFATHFYGTPKESMRYPLFEQKGEGKELWMTEVYVPNSSSDADTWPEALDVAENISFAMTEGNMQAYVWWYIRRFYGPMKEDGTISKRGYCMAHYSKFVRPGYVRIEANDSPAFGVSISAYKNEDEIVIVAVNKSANDFAQNFKLTDAGNINYIEAYTTDSNSNLKRTGNIAHEAERFVYVIPAYSVTTFVISAAETAAAE